MGFHYTMSIELLRMSTWLEDSRWGTDRNRSNTLEKQREAARINSKNGRKERWTSLTQCGCQAGAQRKQRKLNTQRH